MLACCVAARCPAATSFAAAGAAVDVGVAQRSVGAAAGNALLADTLEPGAACEVGLAVNTLVRACACPEARVGAAVAVCVAVRSCVAAILGRFPATARSGGNCDQRDDELASHRNRYPAPIEKKYAVSDETVHRGLGGDG